MDDKIIIRTFGGFSITYKGRTLSEQDNRSKKVWMLLEYIIAFHDVNISRDTLLDLLWTEDSSVSADPANALKTSLHRTRAILDELDLPEKKVIIQKQGVFSWNNSLDCDFDFENFITLCNKASVRDLPVEERIGYYKQAFDIYKGPFLPKCTALDWATNLSIGYQAVYTKLVIDMCLLLENEGRFSEITDYCSTASALDPINADINYYLILGLYRSGNKQGALEQYSRIVKTYYNEYGIEPDERFLKLYNEITTHEKNIISDLSSIQNDLLEATIQRSAYFCDYSVFRHLYRIEARNCVRNGVSIFLVLFTLSFPKGTDDDTHLMGKGMERLKGVISRSLRSNDVFSQYSPSQFIIMLPSACYENSLLVGGRIHKIYTSERPKLNLDISYAVRYLEPKHFDS